METDNVVQLKTGQHVPKRTAKDVQNEYRHAACEAGNVQLQIETLRAQQNQSVMKMAKLAEEYEQLYAAENIEKGVKETNENAEGVSTHGEA